MIALTICEDWVIHMLGIGRWKFFADVFMYKGDIIINIAEKDGKYDIAPEIPDFHEGLKYEFLETKVSGNTLHLEAEATLLPGKKRVSADLIFNGDKCTAKISVPYLGTLELDNGVKIG